MPKLSEYNKVLFNHAEFAEDLERLKSVSKSLVSEKVVAKNAGLSSGYITKAKEGKICDRSCIEKIETVMMREKGAYCLPVTGETEKPNIDQSVESATNTELLLAIRQMVEETKKANAMSHAYMEAVGQLNTAIINRLVKIETLMRGTKDYENEIYKHVAKLEDVAIKSHNKIIAMDHTSREMLELWKAN